MLRFHSFTAAVALAGVLAIPGLAATAPASPARPASAGMATAQPVALTTTQDATQPTGTLHETHGMWRSAALVGATVYNGAGTSIGEISNLLISRQGTVSMAVLSVGGFLGMDSKLIAVPYSALKFVPSQNNRGATGAVMPGGTQATPPTTMAAGAAAAPRQAGMTHTGPNQPAHAWTARVNYSVVLPNSTKASLTKMTAFTYRG